MFEQGVTIQSSLCRTRGLSRYCSTSGFGPRSLWRVSIDSNQSINQSINQSRAQQGGPYVERRRAQQASVDFQKRRVRPSARAHARTHARTHERLRKVKQSARFLQKPQELSDGQQKSRRLPTIATHTYLTRVYTVIT